MRKTCVRLPTSCALYTDFVYLRRVKAIWTKKTVVLLSMSLSHHSTRMYLGTMLHSSVFLQFSVNPFFAESQYFYRLQERLVASEYSSAKSLLCRECCNQLLEMQTVPTFEWLSWSCILLPPTGFLLSHEHNLPNQSLRSGGYKEFVSKLLMAEGRVGRPGPAPQSLGGVAFDVHQPWYVEIRGDYMQLRCFKSDRRSRGHHRDERHFSKRYSVPNTFIE